MIDPTDAPPSQSVHVSALLPARVQDTRIARASQLGDEDIEQLSQAFVDRWWPQVRFSQLGSAVGLGLWAVAKGGAMAGWWPAWVVFVSSVPIWFFAPVVMTRQRRILDEEADRLGISRKLVRTLWWRQARMGFRPKVMREVTKAGPKALLREKHQLEMMVRFTKLARDELRSEETSGTSAESEGNQT